MAEIITAARPYAQAAFEVAQKQSDLQGWLEMLRAISEVISQSELNALIKNPRVQKNQLEGLLLELLGKQATLTQQNFLKILVENQRLIMLPEITLIFETLKSEAEKTLNVQVDSAFEVTEEQQQSLIQSLKKRLGKEIKLECKINKSLLGGVVIRAGDKVIDGSATARLRELSTALA
ncbi:MAG: synthase subunit delta [Pseudomonadota bacterium]|jgi:F-type H+-transporting ATPase subunit delta